MSKIAELLLEYNELIHDICVCGKDEEKMIRLNEVHQFIEDLL